MIEKGVPEWNKLFNRVQTGDTIVFDSVSRMSRNAEDEFELYEKLYSMDVSLVFFKELHINTEIYRKATNSQIAMTGDKVDLILKGVNQYLMKLAKEQIRIAFNQAEKEVKDLHEKTREGIETAWLNGKQIGQKPGAKPHIKKKAPAMEMIQNIVKILMVCYQIRNV